MKDTKEKRATFTPGPWEVSSHQTQIHSERYGLVAALERFTEKSTTHANARLIAAAPEMYEKLCELCNVIIALEEKGVNLPYHYFKDDMSMSDKLREVLAKVDGGEG